MMYPNILLNIQCEQQISSSSAGDPRTTLCLNLNFSVKMQDFVLRVRIKMKVRTVFLSAEYVVITDGPVRVYCNTKSR